MIGETVVQLNAAVRGGPHQVNPSARRFRFQVEGAVGRALVEAETAVDALVELRDVQCSDLWMIVAMIDGIQIHKSDQLLVSSFLFLVKNQERETKNYKLSR